LILTALTLPAFNALFETHLILSVETYGYGLLLLILFVLLVGIGAGTYPAFVLARFQPVHVLRGTGTVQSRGSGWLRKSLVVTQFAISVVLIVSTAVIHQQLRYVQHKNLGFQDEQVVIIDLPTAQAWSMREDLKREAAMQPGVLSATAADAAPGMFYMTIRHKPEEWSSQAQVELPEDESVVMAPAIVDVDYVQTLGLHLVAGRNFSADQPSDIERAYVINETAARRLGWTPEEAIGQPFKSASAGPEGEVIGVVQDFHIGSLRDPIGPVVIQLHESWHGAGHLIARLTPTAIPETMDHLKALIERVAPDEPFTYQFLDDLFDEMYRTEQRLGKIFTTVAILAIFIACLGLFGLASYAAETRTKEIGIRKVLGASVSAIVALLSKDFIKLVAIAFVLAVPLAYVAMHRWLEDFAYHIAISWWVFALAGLAGLVVALLTVSYQSIKAALADPVKSLRYE
jgi:putative ABC transport system permease protein